MGWNEAKGALSRPAINHLWKWRSHWNGS